MLVKLFHIIVPVSYMYTLWYDQMYVELPFPSEELRKMPLKARYIFLTMWCLALQAVYFTFTLLNDLIGTDEPVPKKPPLIRKIRDFTFSIAFPIAIFVSITFWGIYAMNKDFILPEEIEKAFPKWVNHMMHTAIVPFIFIEMFITNKTYPSRSIGVNTITGITITYFIWIHVLYFRTGVWVYPFLDLFNKVFMFLFLIFNIYVGRNLYILGEKLNSLRSPSKVYSNGVSKKK